MKRLFVKTFVFLLILGCTPEQTTVSEYSIKNGLNVPITLRFFRSGLPSTGIEPVSLKSFGGMFKKTAESMGSITSPFEVFDADSIAIIFNGERVQGHNLFEPIGMCLLNQQDYERLGDGKFLYQIKQENLDAAILCENGCD
tara:strand:+ start:325 stop:750 length:426 start_codon:yes stop_codon:yes gene_type:complete